MRRRMLVLGSAMTLGVPTLVGTSIAAPGAPAAQMRAAQISVASFAVAKMTCAACPITVKKAMSAVRGVRSVEVDFASKTATVAFDRNLTNAATIAAASANAGYPAKVKG